ncbi:MAG: D-hexose-6-phosphate mutarotase, partial [Burkholderiaceae bacterium]
MSQDIPPGEFHGLPGVELITPGGARATVLLHGGHVTSWIAAGGPETVAQEQLYLSPRSSYGPGDAIRGGVPVIFPQFNARGPLQRHGFARNKPWELVSAQQEGNAAHAVLRLRDDAESRAAWPHAFVLELRVAIEGPTLELSLSCQNSGDAPLSFMAALHSYLRIGDLEATRLHGLAGVTYWDSVADATLPQTQEWLQCEGDMDRIYFNVES